jgi:outer membrane protein TolC
MLAAPASVALAASTEVLPEPLDVPAVVRLARERRAEVLAARYRAAAASERPKIVSALPDPMLMVSMDHLPIPIMGIDGSITVQQDFPLSGILGARRRAAEAEAQRERFDSKRTELDVELEAIEAFYMLAERRDTRAVLEEQVALVSQLATIARAHLAAGHGMQADVLRLDNERARVEAEQAAMLSEIRASEAMLNASLARAESASVPDLAWREDLTEPLPTEALAAHALASRPELASARAECSRAVAEVDAMRSMYAPMAFVRAGPSYTMLEGGGVMAMVGVTVPVWREKLSAGVSEARAMEAMTAADLSAMQRMVLGRVASARATVIAERARLIALTNDILPRAGLVVESATGSFGAGQGPMVAVLDATRDLRDVRMEEIMARGRLGRARAALLRETGDL